MKGLGEGLMLFCLCMMPSGNTNTVLKVNNTDTASVRVSGGAMISTSLPVHRLMHQLDYSFTGAVMVYHNWQQGDHTGFISLDHFMKYRLTINTRKNFRVSNLVKHQLGVRFFPDSIFQFQPDETSLETRIDLFISKNLAINIIAFATTRTFNSYTWVPDVNGDQVRLLNGSFMTPFICTLSAGMGWVIPSWGGVNLGLSSARFTWIRNREVFGSRQPSSFYGIPPGKRYSLRYGLSLRLTLDKEFSGMVMWSCDLWVFKDPESMPELTFKNFISLKINRFVKISLQTRILYEKEMSRHFQFENLLTAGYFIHCE